MCPDHSQSGPSQRKLLNRWQRRYKKLLKALPTIIERCRTTTRPELIHDLRVTLRRLRLYCKVAKPLLPKNVVTQFVRWSRRMSRATSSVRDLDIVLQWLQGQRHSDEIVERILNRRAQACKNLINILTVPDKKLLDRLQKLKRPHKAARCLALRYAKLESKLKRVVCPHADGFLKLRPARQHEVRQSIRRWRYMRELALSRGKARNDELLRVLVALQDATGSRRNLLVCTEALKPFARQPFIGDLRRALADELASTAEEIQSAFKALKPFCSGPT